MPAVSEVDVAPSSLFSVDAFAGAAMLSLPMEHSQAGAQPTSRPAEPTRCARS